MLSRQANDAASSLDSLPQLPLDANHWQAIVAAMQLSPRQARVAELILSSASHKQISADLGITQPTLKTYLERIAARTGTRGPMQLAMHVLAVSHQVRRTVGVVQKDDSYRRRRKR